MSFSHFSHGTKLGGLAVSGGVLLIFQEEMGLCAECRNAPGKKHCAMHMEFTPNKGPRRGLRADSPIYVSSDAESEVILVPETTDDEAEHY